MNGGRFSDHLLLLSSRLVPHTLCSFGYLKLSGPGCVLPGDVILCILKCCLTSCSMYSVRSVGQSVLQSSTALSLSILSAPEEVC